jgi:PleD family two-component response regulator
LQADVLVREADEAMYMSKNGGRGRYTVHEVVATGTRSAPAA